MTERIYLVGFMGAGKTTVGRIVAGRLGWDFVDLDREIERREGRPVAAIFRESGEPYFRKVETAALRELSAVPRRVIALGGGAYTDPDNRAWIESAGLSVWLHASLAAIEGRIAIDGVRPLFTGREAAARLYARRLPAYAEARVRIDTDGLSPAEAADRVIRAANLG